jgi:hypothetical protein
MDYQIAVGVLWGAWFVHLGLDRMLKENENENERGDSRPSSSAMTIPILIFFLPNVVTKLALLGSPLILKSVHLPHASVLERLNSLLEDHCSLILSEDTQRVFGDAQAIREVTGTSSRSIPICSGFLIAGTSIEGASSGCRLLCSLVSHMYSLLHIAW